MGGAYQLETINIPLERVWNKSFTGLTHRFESPIVMPPSSKILGQVKPIKVPDPFRGAIYNQSISATPRKSCLAIRDYRGVTFQAILIGQITLHA